MGEPRLLSNDELWAIQHTAASVNATTQDILHTALMLGNQIADLRAKLDRAHVALEHFLERTCPCCINDRIHARAVLAVNVNPPSVAGEPNG